MSTLVTEPNIIDFDRFYEELVGAQRELSDDEAERFVAKLALVLANHVGDRAVLGAAIRLARDNTLARAGGRELQ